MTTGQKIAALRKQKDMTQAQLAKMLDVTSQTIHNWEADEVLISVDNLKKLSNFFDVNMDYFVSQADTQAAEVVSTIADELKDAPIDALKQKSKSKIKLVCLIAFIAIVAIACIPIGLIAFDSDLDGLETKQTSDFVGQSLPIILFISLIVILVILAGICIISTIKRRKVNKQ